MGTFLLLNRKASLLELPCCLYQEFQSTVAVLFEIREGFLFCHLAPSKKKRLFFHRLNLDEGLRVTELTWLLLSNSLPSLEYAGTCQPLRQRESPT